VTEHAGTQNIAVSLSVGAPKLALSARSVTFGDTVGSLRTLRSDVFVSNGGSGDLASLGALRIGAVRYGAGGPSGWLSSPAAETGLGSPIVALAAAVGTLSSGRYQATVVVQAARGGTDSIAVTLTVNRPDPAFDLPSIEITQEDVPVDSVAITVTVRDTTQRAIRLQVRNPSNTAVALTGLRLASPTYLTSATGWITGAFLDKTSAPFGSPAELFIAIRPGAASSGRHRAELEVRSSVAKNSPKKLIVVLTTP